MGEIKTQRDARGLTVLVTRPRTFGDVTSRAIPIRTTQNIRKCVITRSMREIRRIGREPKEKLIADAMRVQETQRLDRANQFYNALHRVNSLLRQVNQREEEIKSRVAELGAVNERLHPDVVILDIRLPRGNGLEVLQDIKNHNPRTTVIMLTSYPYPQYRQKCLKAGADFFFDKSTEFEKVTEVLERLTA